MRTRTGKFRLLTALKTVARDERGVSAVLLALSLNVLIGFVALGAETGMWY